MNSYYFFFFQAEDGIRDLTVTGVQTCALPIYACPRHGAAGTWARHGRNPRDRTCRCAASRRRWAAPRRWRDAPRPGCPAGGAENRSVPCGPSVELDVGALGHGRVALDGSLDLLGKFLGRVAHGLARDGFLLFQVVRQGHGHARSEEHTSELQSQSNL